MYFYSDIIPVKYNRKKWKDKWKNGVKYIQEANIHHIALYEVEID